MYKINKYFYLILVCYFINLCQCQKKSCRLSDLESKLKPMVGLFGIKDVKFAESDKEMTNWCRSLPGGSRSAKTFTKNCLKGFSKSIMSVTIYSADKWHKQYCNNKKERDSFISRAKCGNQGKKNTAKCWNNFINDMWRLKNNTNDNMTIPLFCCNFFEWKDCTLETYKRIGPPLCHEIAVDKFDEHITRGSLDPLNIFCGEYEVSDKCQSIRKFLPKIFLKSTRNRTPFPAIFDVFKSL